MSRSYLNKDVSQRWFFWVQKIKSSSFSVDIMKLIIFGMSQTKDNKKTEWVYCDFLKESIISSEQIFLMSD